MAGADANLEGSISAKARLPRKTVSIHRLWCTNIKNRFNIFSGMVKMTKICIYQGSINIPIHSQTS
jgi:hypothetical protein